jgi:hypothetical protein
VCNFIYLRLARWLLYGSGMSNESNRLDVVIANQRKYVFASLAALVVFASGILASAAAIF